MRFSVLIRKKKNNEKKNKCYDFRCLVFYSHIGCFPYFLMLYCLTYTKTIRRYFSCNAVSFSHKDLHAFQRLVPSNAKTLKIHVFVVLFLHTYCYSCILAFWYIRSSKTLIIHVSRNALFISPYEVTSIHFGVLVGKNVKNTQNTRFGNYVFPLRVVFQRFRVFGT